MKKTILVLITFVLVLIVAGCGFWLTHYFIDAKEQRTAFENLSQEYVLEKMPVPELITSSENSSSPENPSEAAEAVSLTTAPPRHDLSALAAVFQKIDDKEYTWESLGRRDKIDYPFVSDNHVLGRWVSVKFVERKEDFAPGHHETDLWLKSLEFLPDGSVNQQYGDDIWRNRWTKGLLLNQSMSTAAKYEIRHIKGKDYLFLEWKMGNYVFGGQPPEYYVFTREL